MQSWAKLQSSLGTIDLSQAGSKISKGFGQTVQAAKEKLGQVAPDEITELPQGMSHAGWIISRANRSVP